MMTKHSDSQEVSSDFNWKVAQAICYSLDLFGQALAYMACLLQSQSGWQNVALQERAYLTSVLWRRKSSRWPAGSIFFLCASAHTTLIVSAVA